MSEKIATSIFVTRPDTRPADWPNFYYYIYSLFVNASQQRLPGLYCCTNLLILPQNCFLIRRYVPVYGAKCMHHDHFSITSCDLIFPEMEQEFRVLFYTRYFSGLIKSNTPTPQKTNKQANKQTTAKNTATNKQTTTTTTKTTTDCCRLFFSRPY